MNYADKKIVETYFSLFEGLSTVNKIELIEKLTRSLKRSATAKKDTFYKSFGAFADDRSAEEIVADIKSSMTFRTRDIAL